MTEINDTMAATGMKPEKIILSKSTMCNIHKLYFGASGSPETFLGYDINYDSFMPLGVVKLMYYTDTYEPVSTGGLMIKTEIYKNVYL